MHFYFQANNFYPEWRLFLTFVLENGLKYKSMCRVHEAILKPLKAGRKTLKKVWTDIFIQKALFINDKVQKGLPREIK